MFRWLTGDLCWEEHGGAWYAKIEDQRFMVVRIQPMPKESWEDDGETCVDLVEIDTSDNESLADALKSCGWTDDDLEDEADHVAEAMRVDAMLLYGAFGPLMSAIGKDPEDLRRRAMKRAYKLMTDNDGREQALDRKVNKIGQTARERMSGSMMDSILRGVAEGNPAAELGLKMYTVAGGNTLGGKPWK